MYGAPSNLRQSQQDRRSRIAEGARPHLTKLEVDQSQWGQLNQLQSNYVDVPYMQGYWKEQATRIQTTSKSNGRSPIFGDAVGLGGQTDPVLPQMGATMRLATSSRQSPNSRNSNFRVELSSRGSMQTSDKKGTGVNMLKIVSAPGTANSIGYAMSPRMTMQRIDPRRNGQEQNGPNSILEEDSIFMKDRMTTQKYAGRNKWMPTDGSTTQENDSLFRSTEHAGDLGSATQRQQQTVFSSNGNPSIYSIKDQIQVRNIIRRKFPQVSTAAGARMQLLNSNNKDFSLSRDPASMSQDARLASSPRGSQHVSRRHAKQQKLFMQQHQLAKFSDLSKKSISQGSNNVKSIAAQSVQKKRHIKRSIDLPSSTVGKLGSYELKLQTQKNSTTNKSPLKGNGIFSRAFENSVFSAESQGGADQNSPEKNFSGRFASQGQQRRKKDFLSVNKKNMLNTTINRLHPQYQLWEGQQKDQRLASGDEEIMQDPKPRRKKTEKDFMSVTDKKNALIDAMAQRVRGQQLLNANEVLASAGITNHRSKNSMASSMDQMSAGGNRNEFLGMKMQQTPKEQAFAVAAIINKITVERERSQAKNKSGANGLKMVGKANYALPDQQTLKQTYSQHQSEKKRQMISRLASQQKDMEGKITLKDYDVKVQTIELDRKDPVTEYVQRFQESQHAMHSKAGMQNEVLDAFGSQLQAQLQANQKKIDERKQREYEQIKAEVKESLGINPVKTAEQQNFIDALVMKEIGEEQKNVFNQCLEEESRLISSMGKDFVEKIEYIKRVAQRDVEHEGKGVINQADPKIHYFLQCKQDLDLALPILEKVFKKTLVLQEYTLSQGHCRGLARACQFFDHRFVNRVLFSNCGIDDQEFSDILNGLRKLRDFKSIIYKMNAFGEKSLRNLEPLLLKRLPNHLQEIKLIDCHMHGSLISKLIDLLVETNSQLSCLSLVNANQTESSFDKVIGFLEHSEYLSELDLSWSKLPVTMWRKFLTVIKDNRQLVSLNISHNKIIEDQEKPTPEMLAEGTWKLTERNMQTMLCFKDFVKYNIYLESINLENTGLIAPAIEFMSSLLTKAQGLRCLHLCANEGISPELTDKIRKRIRAKEYVSPKYIQPYAVHCKQKNKVSKKSGLIGNMLIHRSKTLEKIESNHRWQNIREGLKLKSVINAKRMNEVTTFLGEIDMEGSFLSRKLIIHRHLGLKNLMPGAAQWQIISDKKDECWRCSQHILTLFVWTPRIGVLTSEKDPHQQQYYQSNMESTRDMDSAFAMNASLTPLIASTFNDWRYQPMQEVVKFCMDKDPKPPNFIQELAQEGQIKNETLKTMNAKEKKVLESRKQEYYKARWQTTLISLTTFKKPMVANAHLMTTESLKVRPDQDVYIHLAWVKPGRHTYVISHDNGELSEDEEGAQAQQPEANNLFLNMLKTQSVKQKKRKKQSFYVHDMLATPREEKIPLSFKDRHVQKHAKQKHRERPVFQNWIEDTSETVTQMLNHDKNRWGLRQICETPKEYTHLESVLIMNYQLLTDVYHFLQSKSKRYPWVEYHVIRKWFFHRAIVPRYGVENSFFDQVIKQAAFVQGKQEQDISSAKMINRHKFIEFIVLMAKFVFSTYFSDPNQMREHVLETYTNIKLVKAVQLLLNQTLRAYLEDLKIEWQSFRDNKLWQPECRLLLTMNENHLRKLYSHYTQNGKSTGKKHFKADYMTLDDCMQMFLVDKKMYLIKDQIKTAFVMSKMTVVEESNPEESVKYEKLLYVEFLEFLGRIAEMNFQGSEMEELDLHVKMEHLLDEILQIVNAKRVKQETIIEEFSESDDDY